jgi:hypothetical protein
MVDTIPTGYAARTNWIVGALLLITFTVSVVGDWFFEKQWSNPRWYVFEAVTWGTGLLLVIAVLAKAGNCGRADDPDREQQSGLDVDEPRQSGRPLAPKYQNNGRKIPENRDNWTESIA